MAYKTDIEIAQECKMLPITEIAARAHVDEKYLEQYGRWKAKVDPALLRETEKEDGKLGVAVVMPEAQMRIFPTDRSHSLLLKAAGSGEPVCYKVGSCWSKGDVKRASDWFKIVDEQ